MERQLVYTHRFFLTAGECNGQKVLPVTMLAMRAIETATEHANMLGIGWTTLSQYGLGWVLSRLTFEMDRYPAANENYSLTTWIESSGHYLSERCFEVRDAAENIIGYIRSTWAAIDVNNRTAGDLSGLPLQELSVAGRECPIKPQERLRTLEGDIETSSYRFGYCDIDFNRHVNTVRYIELVLNHWPLEWFDTYMIPRFQITFMKETRCGDLATLRVSTVDGLSSCEVVVNDTRVATSRVFWRKI
jgi:acyl-ACP thioesterase